METMLTASPSWYCSRVSDCNKHGVFCYAARHLLYMVDVATDPPQVKGHFKVHDDRVVGVVLQRARSPEGETEGLKCCTTGEDKRVKLWDLQTQTLIDSHALHKQTPTTIDWSPVNHDLVVSGSERGELVVWRPSKGTSLTYSPENTHIFSLTCSPHREQLVAVGYKSGLILVVDISKQGHIAYRLRGIDDEVHSLCWSPLVGNAFSNKAGSDDDPEDLLLASGSRDASVRVWSCQSERPLVVMKLPSSRAHRRERSEEFSRPRVWVTLCWPESDPNTLLSSGHNGDLLTWDLSETRPTSTVFGQGKTRQIHTRIIFNICTGGPLLNTLCTISMDRQIMFWDLETHASRHCLSTLGGFAYCLRQSPVNPGCLALGVGDNMIRLWQVDRQSQPHECLTLWQGIKSKVTTLSWHPDKEGLLAYGTDDGRVGIYDVLSNKPPAISSTYHKRTVYVVSWGPYLGHGRQAKEAESVEAQVVADTVFIAGLPDNVTAEQLAEHFGSCGTIKTDRRKNRPRIWIYRDRETGKQKGEATVAYVDPEAVVAAIQQFNGKEFEGCVLMVEQATKKSDTSGLKDAAAASSGSYVVYSVGDGAILQHDPRRLDGRAANFNSLVDYGANKSSRPPGHSEMSWNTDYTAVAVGNEDGTVDVWQVTTSGATKRLQLLCQVHVHHKLLNTLAWHPRYTAESSSESRCHHWLASGGNEHVVHVYDLQNMLGGTIDSSQPVVLTESIRQLHGHTNRVTDLAWSVHVEGRLVSVSYDFTAQVWNAKTGEALANYRGHGGRLLSVQWSALDRDLVYTGADDFTVQAWRPSRQTHSTPPTATEKKKQKKSAARTKAAAAAAPRTMEAVAVATEEDGAGAAEGGVGDAEMQEIQALLQQKKAQLQQQQQQQRGDEGDGTEVCEDAEESGDPSEAVYESSMGTDGLSRQQQHKKDCKDKARKRRPKSLMPTTSALDNRGKTSLQQDCVSLSRLLNQDTPQREPVSDDMSHLAVFLNRRAVYGMVKQEVEGHVSRGHTDQQLMLDVFQGGISDSLAKTGEAGQLTDWHLALASMASPAVWQKLCGVYSRQLEAEGQVHKACTYLLAAHMVEDAIELLCKHHFYRDALCLAQLRLSKHDPIVQDLYRRWGDQLSKSGLYELAARCSVALGQPVEAARLLARRSELPALKAATEVCLSAGETDLAVTYAQKYISQCQQQWDWQGARLLAAQHPRFKLFTLTTCVHELLTRQLLQLGVVSDDLPQCEAGVQDSDMDCTVDLPRLFLAAEDCDPLTPWQPHLLEEEAFIHHVVRLWRGRHGVSLGSEELNDLKSQLTALRQASQTQTTTRQVLCQVTVDICLGLVQLLLGRTEMAANAWLVALATCYETEQKAIAEGLCRLLLPQGPDSINKLQHECIALRMAAGGGTTPLHSPRSASISSHPADISTGLNHCTTMDCLRAFYYYTVLEHLVGEAKGQSGRENDSKNPLEKVSNVTSEDTNVNPGSVVLFNLTADSVCKLSKMLLWDVLAERSQLTETANQINTAVAAMVTAHGGQRVVPTNAESSSSSPTPCTPQKSAVGFKLRRYSGEYIPMNADPVRRLSLEIPPLKPHEQIPMSPLIFEKTMLRRMESCSTDYTQMFPETHECSELCSHNEYPPTPSIDQVRGDEDDGEEERPRKTPPKFRLFERGSDSDGDATEEGVMKGVSDMNPGNTSGVTGGVDTPVDRGGGLAMVLEERPTVENQTSAAAAAVKRPRSVVMYEGVPAEWYGLPADVKYRQECVSLLTLMDEQSRVVGRQHELQHLEAIQFPDPVKSARLLLEAVHHRRASGPEAESIPKESCSSTAVAEVESAMQRIADWASGYACLQSDMEFFRTVAGKDAEHVLTE